ncbi:YicC/YloC family endoribonuclease [Ferrimonas balearica]|uniref:YicC/YloC family endoribonuclease n=1 Tax=Ferrimonas balearica TaxID=44012 RepID=UPI001C99074E|nr:YicC/YloC family endoribonuclease [Ferrimonas balearica]MBY5994099.1 YicC family protein [Ferrimonas balearica]
MIHSMTAYGRGELKADWGTASWEIRSVNQRYLETYLRLPEQLRGLEPVLRERLRKRLARGKVEVNLRFELAQQVDTLTMNESLAQQLVDKAQKLHTMAGIGQIQLVDLLKWPGVLESGEQDMDQVSQDLLTKFDEVVGDFIDARASEGKALEGMIQQRLDGISEQSAFVRERMPEILTWQRQKLHDRLAEIKDELDPARIEQELILQAQKVDVAEELDRLDAHVAETRKILKKGGACGRRLDFMMQEFNRESNTLASKSISADITAAAVELKVLIEQMREQIQNIE